VYATLFGNLPGVFWRMVFERFPNGVAYKTRTGFFFYKTYLNGMLGMGKCQWDTKFTYRVLRIIFLIKGAVCGSLLKKEMGRGVLKKGKIVEEGEMFPAHTTGTPLNIWKWKYFENVYINYKLTLVDLIMLISWLNRNQSRFYFDNLEEILSFFSTCVNFYFQLLMNLL